MDSAILYYGILPWFWKRSGDFLVHFGLNAKNEIFHTLAFLAGVMFWSQEMIQHRLYTQKVDVYSFGIVMWELFTGLLPFQNMTAVQSAFAVVNKVVRPSIPNDCLPVLGEIMTRCWDTNPDVRPSFSDVVKMLEHEENEIMSTVRKAILGVV